MKTRRESRGNAKTVRSRKKAAEARKRREVPDRRQRAAVLRRKRRKRRRQILIRSGIFLVILLSVLGILVGKGIPGLSFFSGLRQNPYHVNAACESYRDTVTAMAENYGMEDYVDLILAVMMQESSGELTDVMQSSEGAYNTRYPQEPNGITDTEYSIQCGIQELRHALEETGCSGPEDIKKIEITLQAYNFGEGYLRYMKENGLKQWSEESAQDYARKACEGKQRAQEDPFRENAGIWDYGDQYYPEHVLRYYPERYQKS